VIFSKERIFTNSKSPNNHRYENVDSWEHISYDLRVQRIHENTIKRSDKASISDTPVAPAVSSRKLEKT